MRRLILLPLLVILSLPALAWARANPADELIGLPIEASVYDPATHCSPKPRPGMLALQAWLEENVRGVFWGSYRCEMWGKDEASLHAENRAIDWHLDAAGNAQALARRMGVEELIWDCEYWGAGMSDFLPYRPCYGKRGKLRKNVNKTAAHRDHIHIGMTKAGAAGKTSFWRGHTG